MLLNEFLTTLEENPSTNVQVMLPDGLFVPAHFHVTEVGRVQKDFIDCGGTVRSATSCMLQIWVADDTEHRLNTAKLAQIVRLATPLLKTTDMPVEVEYESGVVSQYPLAAIEVTPHGILLRLESKHTACLAPDRCGIVLTELGGCTTPGCC